jgi:uncharacterized protein (TIGR02271 family)
MALHKISDFDPDYRSSFDDRDMKGFSVYSESDEKIGTVNDILVDEEGRFRYFIVDLGFWIFGKKVLLPVGRARIDYNAERLYTTGLTREQAEDLPEYNEHDLVDYDYEERVRGVYRSPNTYGTAGAMGTMGTATSTGMNTPATDAVAPLESSAALDASAPLDPASSAGMRDTGYRAPAATSYNRDAYKYEDDTDLFNVNEQNHQSLKLYEERLIANKRRVKTGEVTIGKHVETETERVSVPIEKERVVIERVTPTDAGRAVAPGEVDFREGEVARMEVYEETPEIRKEAFVREEVKVKKVVDQQTVNAEETIRREELDVNTGNLPIDENRDRI